MKKRASLASAQNCLVIRLHAAGFVVIYQNPSLGAEERLELKTVAGDRFFDLAELKLLAGDADALEHILALAETLRFPAEDENPGKVN